MTTEPACKTKGCTKPCEPGLDVCLQHGGGYPQARRKSELVRARRELDAWSGGIPDDDPEALDPLLAIENLRRRTIGRIRLLERLVAERLDFDSLEFGLTKEETTTVGEFPGTTTTFEARTPVLVQLLAEENAALIKITELEAKTHFQQARLALEAQRQTEGVALVQAMVTDLVKALGRDPHSPKVNNRVRGVFEKHLNREAARSGR